MKAPCPALAGRRRLAPAQALNPRGCPRPYCESTRSSPTTQCRSPAVPQPAGSENRRGRTPCASAALLVLRLRQSDGKGDLPPCSRRRAPSALESTDPRSTYTTLLPLPDQCPGRCETFVGRTSLSRKPLRRTSGSAWEADRRARQAADRRAGYRADPGRRGQTGRLLYWDCGPNPRASSLSPTSAPAPGTRPVESSARPADTRPASFDPARGS